MTSDNQGPWKKVPDPAYQGAKPATYSELAGGYGFFGPAGPFTPSDAMSALLAQNWWVVALRGLFALAFGIIAVLLPGVTLTALVFLFSAYMLVDGILAIIAGLRAAQRHERWGVLVLEGIIDIAVGVIAFLWPVITIIAFVYLMGAWAVINGALLWAAAFRLEMTRGRWLMGLSGTVSVIWGLFLLLVHPLAGAVAVAWYMGAYALFFGGALLGLAFRLRRLRDELPRAGAVVPGT